MFVFEIEIESGPGEDACQHEAKRDDAPHIAHTDPVTDFTHEIDTDYACDMPPMNSS